jgi:BirA family transcriptional regulator, biotin operon repressor / biotin---[acetyl-CoA-carboxylase] ligase
MSPSHDLSSEAIQQALSTRRLGGQALYFPQIGSTNDLLRERANAGAPEGLLIVANEQLTGHGRAGRSWWAPPGSNLLMSLLLRPTIPVMEAAQTTMCLGLGAIEGIATITGLEAALKWPNDLLLGGRKLGGMLTEIDAVEGRLNWVVLGLGINVNLDLDQASSRPEAGVPAADVPPEVALVATSLSWALGRPVERLALLAAIIKATEHWYEGVLRGESPHAEWAAHLDTLGRRVQIALPGGEALYGVAQGVDRHGALLVIDDAGDQRTVWAGDVTTVRTAGQGVPPSDPPPLGSGTGA